MEVFFKRLKQGNKRRDQSRVAKETGGLVPAPQKSTETLAASGIEEPAKYIGEPDGKVNSFKDRYL